MYSNLTRVTGTLVPVTLVRFEFSEQIFDKTSNIKFHKNLSSGSRVVEYRQTGTTKLIVTFCNSANTLKNAELKTVT